MSRLFNQRNLVVLLLLFNCFIPILTGAGHRHRHKHKQYRTNRLNRSPADTEPDQNEEIEKQHSPRIKVTVNYTIVNITKTSHNKAKSLSAPSLPPLAATRQESPRDPKLKSVNKVAEESESSGTSAELSSIKASSKEKAEVMLTEHHRKLLDAEIFKKLLRDLLTRLDSYPGTESEKSFSAPDLPNSVENNELNPLLEAGHRHINPHNVRHCTLHGLWLSTVAGAAIELIPEQQEGHIEIHTRILELPDNPYPPLINSQWTGKGIISQESPTTLTIVFQEHIDTPKQKDAKEKGSDDEDDSTLDIQLPRTAVFVGQCLVCQGNPTLQGAWVVFPASQTCTSGAGFLHENNENGQGNLAQEKPNSPRMTTQDSIYLLRYYH